ncbi:hypothetical protein ACFL13_00005, partial [Patescibacteria group bacterium]
EVRHTHPDYLSVTGEKSIGISQVREITKFLTTKPYSLENKYVVIEDAHRLTTQAQNALLKTLEEPPDFAIIVLLAKTENSLLPTVISRCRKITIKSSYTRPVSEENIPIDLGERLDHAGNLSKLEREEIVDLIEGWVVGQREQMLDSADPALAKNIFLMMQIKEDLEKTNVNKRLALENLLLQLEL